ncbi:MAG: FMN-binding protein [Spirochaetales bacterium]|nr:FMN-binding protein [Spirochaetales bacterium]
MSYIVELKGQGYGGDLQILAGYRRDGELTAAVLMANGETPGLGKNAEKAGYMDKFIGTGGERPVPVKKTQLLPQEAEGVSGSTVTFGGIARALSAGAEEVKLLEDLR